MGFGSSGITWENVDQSNVKGLELEGKKKISSRFDIRANITLVKSEARFVRRDFQVIEGQKQYLVIDTLFRPMYGQAPYLINAILSYKTDSLGLNATLSYNVQGPRLVIAGAAKGRPDVYELPRHTVDFKVSKSLNKHFTLSITIRDILNAPLRRSYDLPSGWVDYSNRVQLRGIRRQKSENLSILTLHLTMTGKKQEDYVFRSCFSADIL